VDKEHVLGAALPQELTVTTKMPALSLTPFLYHGMSNQLVFYWVQITSPHCGLTDLFTSLEQNSCYVEVG